MGFERLKERRWHQGQISAVDNDLTLRHTMYDSKRCVLRISDFEWDEGNALHLQLEHGIEPDEAEEVFAVDTTWLLAQASEEDI